MKKIYLLVVACVFALTIESMAQGNVTFAVDMNDVTTFDPNSDVLRVAGDFQNWTPMDNSNANVLTDPDGNGVYSVEMAVSQPSILFKYVINDWGTNEFGDNMNGGPCTNDEGNRVEAINGDTELPVYVYSSCDVSSLTVSNTRDAQAIGEISLSPNPASTQTIISMPKLVGENATVRVVSSLGQVVDQYIGITNGKVEIDVTSLNAGFYLLEVSNEDGARVARRLVVR